MNPSRKYLLAVIAVAGSAFVPEAVAWQSSVSSAPYLITSEPVSGFAVDRGSRADVLSFYHHIYLASENSAAVMGWTGNYATCDAGTTSATYKEMVRRRVNYFRAMAGQTSDITFDAFAATGIAAPKWRCAQKAALMQTVHNPAFVYETLELSHTPPTWWECYSAEGANGSNRGNLAVGVWGPEAMDAYMNELDDNNIIVGHRRWILYSRAQDMSSGDVPAVNLTGEGDGWYGGNCLYVLGNETAPPTPKFIGWPSAGFFPAQLGSDRWSLSYPGAVFANATVTMTGPGVASVLVVSRNVTTAGDNTIVWQPLTAGGQPAVPLSVAADTTYTVTVSGISGAGVPASHSYAVTLINTDDPGVIPSLTGPAAPPAVGARYTVNPVSSADHFSVKVGPVAAGTWKEGGETSTSSFVLDQTTSRNGSNQSVLFQSAVGTTVAFTPKAGSRSLHLCFAAVDSGDQIVELARDIVPTTSSELKFWKMFRFSTAVTACVAETSVDGGNTWDALVSLSPSGNILDSTQFEVWSQSTTSLASRAGKLMRLRFRLTVDESIGAVEGVTHNYGCFLDEIEVTNSSVMDNAKVTSISAGAGNFILNSSFANGGLVPGTSYFMAYQPVIGFTEFDYSNVLTVAPTSATGYSAWVAGFYPALNGQLATADHDKDGKSNLLEYGFGSDPTSAGSAVELQPIKGSNSLALEFTKPADVSGVSYKGQFSLNLSSWEDLPNSGSGSLWRFQKSTSAGSGFIRVAVSMP